MSGSTSHDYLEKWQPFVSDSKINSPLCLALKVTFICAWFCWSRLFRLCSVSTGVGWLRQATARPQYYQILTDWSIRCWQILLQKNKRRLERWTESHATVSGLSLQRFLWIHLLVVWTIKRSFVKPCRYKSGLRLGRCELLMRVSMKHEGTNQRHYTFSGLEREKCTRSSRRHSALQ